MTVNLSIKDVPDELAERLRQRAARNHRSLQGELMAIIERAAQAELGGEAAPSAARPSSPRSRVQGHKPIEQLLAEREAAGWKPDASLARAPLAVDIIRADRGSR